MEILAIDDTMEKNFTYNDGFLPHAALAVPLVYWLNVYY